jgi:hypothetical protein
MASNIVETYQLKFDGKDDQIIRQKLQMSNVLLFERILHGTREM